MARMTLEYWKDEGRYVGRLVEVPGVISQGKTLKSLRKNILHAYRLMLDDRPVINHPTKSISIPVPA
ncbi:MAG: type II toxin-antitoxin system HicB family antitoxin [Elusimicrobiota bacterium]